MTTMAPRSQPKAGEKWRPKGLSKNKWARWFTCSLDRP